MENTPKKPKRTVDVLLFLVVIICAALILLELFLNVRNELQGVMAPVFV